MNALITWASGEQFCRSDGFKIYVNSSLLVNAERFVLTHDMPVDVENDLNNQNIHVVRVKPEEVYFLLRDRHFHFWKWLGLAHYNGYGFVDCKDVLFQADPFSYLGNMSNRVILTCEGMDHEDSDWNLKEQFQAQIDVRQFRIPCENRPVINGGVVFGDGDCLRQHFLLLWATTLKSLGGVTDQGVLNYLYNFLEEMNQYNHTDPRRDNFCLTGEAAKLGLIKYTVEEGLFRKGDKPYVMVHQWDRLPEADSIKQRWLGN